VIAATALQLGEKGNPNTMSEIDRRKFMGNAAGAVAGALLAAGCQESKKMVAPGGAQVRLGIIGVGSRGQELMRTFLRIPGVRFTGLCDVYEPRFAAGRAITAEETPIYHDHRELLAAKEIDAVVVATPLSFHSEQAIAALESGRHVYGEKSMAFTVEECDRIVETVKRTGKYFQVGLQYHYATWFRETLRHIREGRLGQITQICAYWHRNNNWRRPVPVANDRKLERLINWRMYKEYSLGLMAELASHHICFANEVFRGGPESVVGSGGIDYWKDGRETYDNVQVTYRYPGGQTLFFSAMTTNSHEGAQIRVYGTEGTAIITEGDAFLFYESKKLKASAVTKVLIDRGLMTGASYMPEMPYRGKGEAVALPADVEGNANMLACESFIHSVLYHQPPEANEHTGWAEGVAVILGNQAIEQGERIWFRDYVQKQAGA
jgi:predicted dehydrogenase